MPSAGFEPTISRGERPQTYTLGYGYIEARTDTTQQSGQTPDKEAEKGSRNLLFMLAATLIQIRLECYLPQLSGAKKVSLFRADSLPRYLL
jgi:hypothetical protein